jgi:hypothetical protein
MAETAQRKKACDCQEERTADLDRSGCSVIENHREVMFVAVTLA